MYVTKILVLLFLIRSTNLFVTQKTKLRNHQLTNEAFKMKKRGLKFLYSNKYETICHQKLVLNGFLAIMQGFELVNWWFRFLISQTGYIINIYLTKIPVV